MSKSLAFALIVCTYKRSQALLRLLESVKHQTFYPNDIIIVDGSPDTLTKEVLELNSYNQLTYYQVEPALRGLTKQRNFGISKVSKDVEVVCFLDDDTILEPTYFEQLLSTYRLYPHALGVGGYITNEVSWKPHDGSKNKRFFYFGNWMRAEPFRFRVRCFFGLQPDTPPCHLPSFSHGRSVSFLPPDNSIYEVEHFMGGVASYRKEVFDCLLFSNYFEGYGLYEDAEFCFRLLKLGKLYVHTGARLEHHHEALGRPNMFKYGKMVLINGWYVWRVRHFKPSFKACIKWHATALLLTLLTFSGIFKSSKKKEQLQEGLGRFVGWWSLLFNKPKVDL